jgi:diguanylate cyclase (GGDEF)-like protein
MKILIAEDLAPAALYLRRTLEKMGHETTHAPDGEEAWRIIQSGEVSVLISDWMMPRLSGPDLCRRIRAAGDGKYIYIILLTSLNDRENRLEGLRAGADDFLTKPPDPDELAVRLEIAGRILELYDELAVKNARLIDLATIDELTGVKNRRRFREDHELLFAQATRHGSELSILMLDIDHFKQYNDTFGHPAGDEVLRRFGKLLLASVRGHDVVARYGGEEFVVLMPGTGTFEAFEVAERLTRAIASEPWPLRPVTASIGVATSCGETSSAADLLEGADQALYRSKKAGRNRISVHQFASGEPAHSS